MDYPWSFTMDNGMNNSAKIVINSNLLHINMTAIEIKAICIKFLIQIHLISLLLIDQKIIFTYTLIYEKLVLLSLCSLIISVGFGQSSTQTINLPQGWSMFMFSTYIQPSQANINSVMTPVVLID